MSRQTRNQRTWLNLKQNKCKINKKRKKYLSLAQPVQPHTVANQRQTRAEKEKKAYKNGVYANKNLEDSPKILADILHTEPIVVFELNDTKNVYFVVRAADTSAHGAVRGSTERLGGACARGFTRLHPHIDDFHFSVCAQ